MKMHWAAISSIPYSNSMDQVQQFLLRDRERERDPNYKNGNYDHVTCPSNWEKQGLVEDEIIFLIGDL